MKVILSGFLGAVIGGVIASVIVLNLQIGGNYSRVAPGINKPIGSGASAPEPGRRRTFSPSAMPGFESVGRGEVYGGDKSAASGVRESTGESGTGSDTEVGISDADTVGGIREGRFGGGSGGQLLSLLPVEFKRGVVIFGDVFPIGHALIGVLTLLLVISIFCLVLVTRLHRNRPH